MIRQFTIVPALLGIFAMIISACSAEVGGGGSDGSGVNTSASSSETNKGSSTSNGSSEIKSIVRIDIENEEEFSGEYLSKDGQLKSFHNSTSFGYHEALLVNLSGIKLISENGNCGLTESNDLYCWGDNEYGQLANGTYESPDDSYYEPATAFKTMGDIRSFRSIEKTTCAINFDNELYCWGRSDNQLFGENVNKVNEPVKIDNNVFDFKRSDGYNVINGISTGYVKIDGEFINQNWATWNNSGYNGCDLFGNKIYCGKNGQDTHTQIYDQEFNKIMYIGTDWDYEISENVRFYFAIDTNKNLWEIKKPWDEFGQTYHDAVINKYDDNQYLDIKDIGNSNYMLIRDTGEVFYYGFDWGGGGGEDTRFISDTILGGNSENNVELDLSKFIKIEGIDSAISFPQHWHLNRVMNNSHIIDKLDDSNLCVLTSDKKIQCWATGNGFFTVEL